MDVASLPNEKSQKYLQVSSQIESLIQDKVLLPGGKLPGERTLAEQFQVSPVTVSKGLRDLVRRGVLVRKVGSGTYVSGDQGKLGTAKTYRIGVFSHYLLDRAPQHSLYQDWMQLLFKGFSVADWGGREFELLPFVSDDFDYVRIARENQLSGLVIIGPLGRFFPRLTELANSQIPFVIFGARIHGLENYCFSSDDLEAGRNAVAYLTGLGHRKIGIVSGYYDAPPARDRLHGFWEGLWRAGVVFNPNWLVGGDSVSYTSGEELPRLEEILRSPERPTAFFVANIDQALTVYKAAKNCGLKIPEDLSVVGFDDMPYAEHLSPPLTTFRQQFSTIFMDAARAMNEQILTQTYTRPAPYPVEMVVRESCTPPSDT